MCVQCQTIHIFYSSVASFPGLPLQMLQNESSPGRARVRLFTRVAWTRKIQDLGPLGTASLTVPMRMDPGPSKLTW